MQTHDVNIQCYVPLMAPAALTAELPVTPLSAQTVVYGRRVIQGIIAQRDQRLMVITGPCSIHDEAAAVEYAGRLRRLQEKVRNTLFLIMRVYFEKPRTTIGWKGLINDPFLDGTCDMLAGLRKARRILGRITELGVPTATELLDPVIPQYITDLVCWTAIGARTTESQTHREMASGLSMPVGFKNGTDGTLETAINAVIAARSPQSFLGIDQHGRSCVVRTCGNRSAHLVLRGGPRPNYDSVSIRSAVEMLQMKKLPATVVVDCSHANCRKRHLEQSLVFQDVLKQRLDGNGHIVGLMLESHLNEGAQENTGGPDGMRYGVSITDACISWEQTEALILHAHEQRHRTGLNHFGLLAESGNAKARLFA
jgi:3-deoxy-7-phosphoheptulonate synthase